MKERERNHSEMPSALLVGVDTGEGDFAHSMEELVSLTKACGKQVVGIITQKMENVNKAFYIGTGKVREVKELAAECEAGEVIFDNTLSLTQMRNLTEELALPVSDRTNLILDIFALRARTREAKLQVESARLQYMLPRLAGLHESLGRQGGASGSMSNKGLGEKKIELDRRRIEHRISELRRELEHIEQTRQTQRKKRENTDTPQVALVGYTNAGKSTIMNRILQLCGAQENKNVLEKDMLFATLETSVRRIETGDNRDFFLTDTVGFIHKLPHNLVQAFHSTLEEVRFADLLVQVVDFSDESHREHRKVTEETLRELGAGEIPQIIVYNKADLCENEMLPRIVDDHIYMAAGKNIGVEELVSLLKERLYACREENHFCIPYEQSKAAAYFMEYATVLEQQYREDGIYMHVICRSQDAEKYAIFKITEECYRNGGGKE